MASSGGVCSAAVVLNPPRRENVRPNTCFFTHPPPNSGAVTGDLDVNEERRKTTMNSQLCGLLMNGLSMVSQWFLNGFSMVSQWSLNEWSQWSLDEWSLNGLWMNGLSMNGLSMISQSVRSVSTLVSPCTQIA